MEKLYKVQMNSKGMPNFSTAVEVADRPQGEWIDKGAYAICSNCRAHSEVQYDGVPVSLKTRYCPNCGAQMKGKDNV